MWLARDIQSKKYVAVKVCTADSKPREVGVLSDLRTSSRCCSGQPLGKTMIPSITDQFSISGPNGTHDCYVGALGRASLAGLKDGSWIRLFRPDVARVLAAQLVLAVEYIHAQGCVHGDLHLGNILLEMPPGFDQLSVENLYKEYGEPELDPVIHLDGKPLPPNIPSHGVVPVWLGKASEDITLAEAKLLITDFGEAFSPSKESQYEYRTPLILRPPEARFEPESPLSFPSDIWTLACSIWTLIAQRPLFEGFMATQDDMTCEHVDTLGILPREWWGRWDARHDRFTEDGTPINRNPYRSWDDRFEDSVQQPRRECGMVTFDEEERDAVSKMLRAMLAFRPEDRITARQVLDEEWMVKWALPLYYDSRRKERW
ncbi:uncharacterized protein LDX57_003186 [Aspergillus melleus]|uniref:uncharacterized protein n=1 Tax=Aspergillus melleus TaxID=138277 RepID=UPI001E8DA26E|nr:uncharacterized protein LDX57_003186 [Aspergillus melleus]KAH8425433.1 hypothetical protein LDX57_003186 [Aspergillus melleus]